MYMLLLQTFVYERKSTLACQKHIYNVFPCSRYNFFLGKLDKKYQKSLISFRTL